MKIGDVAGQMIARSPYLMQAGDGTLIEVFEWKSDEAKAAAHANEQVRKIWGAMMEVADFPPLNELVESARGVRQFCGGLRFCPFRAGGKFVGAGLVPARIAAKRFIRIR